MDTRYLICCAGTSSRWKNYTGVPKQLAKIDGTPILCRTVSLFSTDTNIVAFDERFKMDGVNFLIPSRTALDDTGLGHSEQFWDKQKNNVILFGDVYFSDDAVRKIKSFNSGIVFYGRSGAGLSGHRYGEIFAVGVSPDCQDILRNAFTEVKKAKASGSIWRAGGWECYRYLNGIPLSEHSINGNFVEIDDETDDFDTPDDFDSWMRKFRKVLMVRI